MLGRLLLAGSMLVVTASPVAAGSQAGARLIGADGETVGRESLQEGVKGVVIDLTIEGLPPGEKALHIHESGTCETPGFQSAGGHYNPRGKEHGHKNPKGPHAGDLPNLFVDEDGKARVQVVATGVTLRERKKGTLFPPGGTALVIHEGPDDHRSDPAGDAGDRIACGVIERRN